MSFDEYIKSCRLIADKFGKYDEYYDGLSKISGVIPYIDQTITYEDGVIEITASKVSNAMLVRKLDNDNPVIYSRVDGHIYRAHGEMWELEDHIGHIINIIKHS